jgi:hypothetical protein
MTKRSQINKKIIENMRDCVKEGFRKGCERGAEFIKMRHAIILELHRLGYDYPEIKDVLLEWNKKCEKPLSPSKQKIHLQGYVDWVAKNQCKIGCNALRDYCPGEEKCQFYLKTTHKNRELSKELPFDMQELDKFLTERFKAAGYVMMLIVKTLRKYQCENATGIIIIIGLRKISSAIRDQYNHSFGAMDILRKIKLLIEAGVLEQVVKGKRGNFSNLANGYKFLPWKHP